MASRSPKVLNIRLAILDAAHQHFSHFGFAKVTMSEIARDVGMGKASLYYYFPAKEDLFKAVVLREQEDFAVQIRILLGKKEISASEKLARYIEYRFEYSNKLMNLNIPDLYSSEKMRPLLKDLFQSFAKNELLYFERIIREGRQQGEFLDIPSVERMAKTFLHVLQGLRMRIYRNRTGPQVEPERIEELRNDMKAVTTIFIRSMTREPEGHTLVSTPHRTIHQYSTKRS